MKISSTLINMLAFSVLLLFMACNTSKKSKGNESCEQMATVQDFSGLDGCGILIVLDNGDKYLPIADEFEGKKLQAGQKISFGYKEAEAMASICMAESKIIELTCLNILEEGIPEKIPCDDINEPMSKEWMAKLLKSHQPEQVIKYNYRTDGWAYLFTGKKVYLYDCQGTLICENAEGSTEECTKLVMPGAKGKIIWQGEGNKE